MWKIKIFLLLAAVITTGCSHRAGVVTKSLPGVKQVKESMLVEKVKPAEFSPLLLRGRPESAFPVGEKLSYKVKWLGIPVADITLEVEGLTDIDEHKTLRLIARGRMRWLFRIIYKIDTSVTSYFDPRHLFPRRFERERFGGRKDVYIFDQDKHAYIYTHKRKEWRAPIPSRTQDILSFLYVLRLLKYEERAIELNTTLEKRSYRVEVSLAGEENVTVPAGSFRATKITPKIEKLLNDANPKVTKKAGKLWIWLSNDRRRLPVLIKSKLFLGTITAVLINYE